MVFHLDEKERWGARAEAERRFAPNGELNAWRMGVFQEKLIDIGFNLDLINFIFTQPLDATLPPTGDIKIADFCSGPGYLGFHVAKQLTKPGRSVSAVGYDKFTKASWPDGKPKVLIPTRQCSLTEIDGEADFFDAGLFRFAWPFISHELRPEVCKRLFGVMKEGSSIVVLNDGAIDEKSARVAHELFIEGIVAGGGETEESARSWLYTSSYDEIKSVGEAAGFEAGPAMDLTDTIISYNSPEAMAKSRGLNAEQTARLIDVYARAKQEGVIPFEPDPNSLRSPWRMYTCTLVKPKASSLAP